MTLQLVVPIAIVVFLLFATFEQENQPSLPMTNVTYEKTHFLIFDNPSLPISKEYSDIYSRMFPKGGHVNLITIHQAEESGMSIWFNYVKDAYTQDPSRALHEILGGLDLTTLDGKKNNIEVWYNGQGYHAVAFILSTFFSVNVRHNLGMNYGIDVYNWPLPYTPHDRKHMPFNPLLSLTLGISMAFVSAFYVMPYIKVSLVHFLYLQKYFLKCENRFFHIDITGTEERRQAATIYERSSCLHFLDNVFCLGFFKIYYDHKYFAVAHRGIPTSRLEHLSCSSPSVRCAIGIRLGYVAVYIYVIIRLHSSRPWFYTCAYFLPNIGCCVVHACETFYDQIIGIRHY